MSNCDVCISGPDFDGQPEFLHCEIRHARKPHTCCECGKEIKPSEQYEHVRGKWDGDMFTFDTCAPCYEIRDVFSCGEGYIFGELWCSMEDYAFERLTTASPCFVELSPPAKAFLLERWRVWKGL